MLGVETCSGGLVCMAGTPGARIRENIMIRSFKKGLHTRKLSFAQTDDGTYITIILL